MPDAAKGAWDEIEIEPVRCSPQGNCEPTDEGNEDFWSVYLHQKEGGVACIADLPTKELAISLRDLISNAAGSFSAPVVDKKYPIRTDDCIIEREDEQG